ncbi:FISUMP domain-containing protein [Balneolaceae bacterium ANBcel3]|nr:FISUMP domain-containing protein [Balneolaceae bacterium ANBcel3]
MNYSFRMFFLPVLGLFLLLQDASNRIEYSVEGRLADADGESVTDRAVSLRDTEGHVLSTGTTDEEGLFRLSYAVESTATAPDHEPLSDFRLGTSYPNPFNPKTHVPFEVPESGTVHISVYNILGQQLLSRSFQAARGSHLIEVNLGGNLAQGAYLLKVQGDGYMLSQTMTFVSAGIGGGRSNITLNRGGTGVSSSHKTPPVRSYSTDIFTLQVDGCDEFEHAEFEVSSYIDTNLGDLELIRHTYPLSIHVEGEGSVSEEVLTAKSYEHGTRVRLTAVPDEGWRFDRWQGGLETEQAVAEITVEEAMEVTAVFERRTYPLTIHVQGEGSVSEEVLTAKSYEHGTRVRLTAVPDEGWLFNGWQGSVADSMDTIELTIDEPTEVTAVFEHIHYPLNITIRGEGHVEQEVITAKSYGHGTRVRLTAIPAEEWRFATWSGDLIDASEVIDIEMVSPVELTARFREQERPPVVETSDVHSIEPTTAVAGGEVVHSGYASITSRGVVWSTHDAPSLSDHEGLTNEGEGDGVFVSEMEDLKPYSLYYYRAYATNSSGTSYGETIAFDTPPYYTEGGGLTDIDGNTYRTVINNGTEWMAENLIVTHYRDGSPIITGLSHAEWRDTTSGAYIVPSSNFYSGLNGRQEVIDAYGIMYNWFAVTDPRGICPAGWRVPDDSDWDEFVDYAMSKGYSNNNSDPNGVANTLKSRRQIDSPLGPPWATEESPRWPESDTHHGLDYFGFSGYPGGYRNTIWTYYSFTGRRGYWWSLDEHSDTSGRVGLVLMDYSGRIGSTVSTSKNHGLHVRCIKN